jgi:hypothetical protein
MLPKISKSRKSKLLVIACGLGIGGFAVVGTVKPATSQAGPLVIAIYTPSINWGTSAAKKNYAQSLGKAISAQVGRKVEAKAFSSFSQLKSANPDFAIVDGQCYSVNSGRWSLLANSKVRGKTSQSWSLYSNQGRRLDALRGKRLAYVKTGCRDTAFLENAMLESEVALKYFGGRVGKSDINAAVSQVATLKTAEAVFAPTGSGRGLTKVFTAGSVPTPAFVAKKGLPGNVVSAAKRAVTGFGASGAISGWSSASGRAYSSLRGRMGRRVKKGIFATPRQVSLGASDVLKNPTTLDDTMDTEVLQHFEAPPKRQGVPRRARN